MSLIAIHALQSLLALVVIGCSAVKLSQETSPSSGFTLAIFTAIVTVLGATYIIATSFIAKSLYKLWTAVACNVFTLVFWVTTIGGLADAGGCGGYRHHSCYRKRYEKGIDEIWSATLALSVVDGILSLVGIGVICYTRRY